MISNVTQTVIRRPKGHQGNEMIYIKKSEYAKLMRIVEAVQQMGQDGFWSRELKSAVEDLRDE